MFQVILYFILRQQKIKEYFFKEKDNINKNENIQKEEVRGYEQNFINNM